MAISPSFLRSSADLLDPLGFSRNPWVPFNALGILDHGPAHSFARDMQAVANTRADWKETADAHVYMIDFPGLKKEEIKVEVEDQSVLKVSAERRNEEEELRGTETWHQVERLRGKFMRRFRLPEGVDVDAMTARLEDGVLTVKVPKVGGERSSRVEGRRVEVSTDGGGGEGEQRVAESRRSVMIQDAPLAEGTSTAAASA